MASSPAKPPRSPPPVLQDRGPLEWSVDDVCLWAQGRAHIAAVAPVLRDHAVDGHVLVHYVTNTVLADELGIAAFGTRVHVLEAIEALRWSFGITQRPQPPPQRRPTSASTTPPSQRSPSSEPESESESRDPSPDPDDPRPKRSASRVADAEKKRQKRAELKKNPVLYAEYLQKERERNARRRARLRAERRRTPEQDHAPPASSANALAHATAAYAPFAADLPAPAPAPAVHIRNPLQPPPHNLRAGPDPPARPDDPVPVAAE
ncbi:hypothetical protein GGF46_002644 [Coemansia sp. RSA 552]|nr:hypothetical protein GGF46_002644 [Coemansia sp. RSA 552]